MVVVCTSLIGRREESASGMGMEAEGKRKVN